MNDTYRIKDGPLLKWQKCFGGYQNEANMYVLAKRHSVWTLEKNRRCLTEAALGETDTFKGSQYIQRRTLKAIKEAAETHFRLRLLQCLEPVQSPSVASGS